MRGWKTECIRRVGVGVALCLMAWHVMAAPRAADSCFSEADWQALQRSTARTGASGVLLYVWSPRMVLAAVHAHEVAQVAAEEGLQFVPVHDGRLPPAELQQALQALAQRQQSLGQPDVLASTRAFCTPSLVQQDAYRHFPTAWLVQAGRHHPVPLVSAMPPEYWRLGIRLRARELAQAASAATREDAHVQHP